MMMIMIKVGICFLSFVNPRWENQDRLQDLGLNSQNAVRAGKATSCG